MQAGDTMTAGIVNIPLTMPAKLFFVSKDMEKRDKVIVLMNANSLTFTETWTKKGTVSHIMSNNEVSAGMLKMIWRNFKSYHPRIHSKYRYFFYEVDTHDMSVINHVVSLYCDMKLPVLVHKTLHGYHFISVKPILRDDMIRAVDKVSHLNPKYPPITLRIMANKSPTELEYWKDSFIVSDKYHYDTRNLHQLIMNQKIEDIAQKYIVVWYKI